MQTIELKHTLPHVFATSNDVGGDIWQHDVVLERGRTYLIEAASGTGKSSLCSYLIGYRADYEGLITFDGRNIRTLTVAEWADVRCRHLSHLFQELRLFPELTAYENVKLKNNLTGFKSGRQIRAWFDALGIGDKRDVLCGRLSFGQQQRVALIRALCQPFDFLLADEPVSHLDEANSRTMADILLEEARAQGAGIVITSIGKRLDLPYDKTFSL